MASLSSELVGAVEEGCTSPEVSSVDEPFTKRSWRDPPNIGLPTGLGVDTTGVRFAAGSVVVLVVADNAVGWSDI